MSNVKKPNYTASAVDLTGASLTTLLLYGLTLDDEDPGLGVLLCVRSELGLITSLVEGIQPGSDFDFTEIAPVLESIGRRIDVGIELMVRAKQAGSTSEASRKDENGK
jgi:hypothetical protein